jgi:hypothetical protein
VGGEPFKLTNNDIHPHAGIAIQQERDMIGLNVHCNDGVAIRFLLGKDKLLHASSQRTSQHLPAILRTKDDMVLTTVHNALVRMIRVGILAQFHRQKVVSNYYQDTIARLFRQRRKRLKRVKGSYPTAQAGGFYALLYKVHSSL